MDELKEYLPGLMVAAGGTLQWLRQFKAFREEWYHAIAVALGVGAFWLVTPYAASSWRAWWISCIDFLTVGGGGLALIWGGTFIVSNGAKAVAASNPEAGVNSVVLPLTNSK